MAQHALPGAAAHRTVTVRVRTLLTTAGILAAAGLLWWALAWATGMRPLAQGSVGTDPGGLAVISSTPSAIGGPNLYRWKAGGRYTLTFAFHNSASVPVTITGVDGTPGGWDGAISGPTLQNSTTGFQVLAGPFQPVRVPADAYREVAVVFHANPKALCGGGVSSVDAITLHFTTLGIFHNTQSIPLDDEAAFSLARHC